MLLVRRTPQAAASCRAEYICTNRNEPIKSITEKTKCGNCGSHAGECCHDRWIEVFGSGISPVLRSSLLLNLAIRSVSLSITAGPACLLSNRFLLSSVRGRFSLVLVRLQHRLGEMCFEAAG